MKRILLLFAVLAFLSCSTDDSPTVEEPKVFTLTLKSSPEGAGSIAGGNQSVREGEEVTLTANPSTGFTFLNWSGGISGSENPVSFVMNGNKTITAVFEESEEEQSLEENIIGMWEVDTDAFSASAEIKQNSAEPCHIFSLVFNSDGTFIISYRAGELIGTYLIDGPASIDLGDVGSISDISFSNGLISFHIDLTGICSARLQAIINSNYEEGDCVSFLNCNDGSVWRRDAEDETEFLIFTNDPGNTWFEHRIYKLTNSCIALNENNQSGAGSYTLLGNDINRLIYLYREGDQENIVTITLGQDDLLTLEQEGTVTRTAVFQRSDTNSLNNFSNYSICEEKTYVPGDTFEQILIDLGYDDVMDDYVLTANINSIDRLILYEPNNGDRLLDLTGIEDFIGLTELEVWTIALPEIDLTKNINLERLVIGSRELTGLDLTQNKKLRSLYVEFVNLPTIDLSKNIELKVVEFSQTEIQTLDITGNLKLEMLTVEGGNLTSIESTLNNNMVWLDVEANPIREFDVFNFPNLEFLELSVELTAIDVSHLNRLTELDLTNNQLESLNVSQNENLEMLYVKNNPGLSCIKVNQGQLETINNQNNTVNLWQKDDGSRFSLDCAD